MYLFFLLVVGKLIVEYAQWVHNVHHTHIEIHQSHPQILRTAWHEPQDNVWHGDTYEAATIKDKWTIFDAADLLRKVDLGTLDLNFVGEDVAGGEQRGVD